MSPKEKRRNELYTLLGELPARDRQIAVKEITVKKNESHILEKLVLDLNGFEPVPAYFVRPCSEKQRRPTILYNHAHGGNYVLGKDELIQGRPSLQEPPYARLLTSMGYNALCIDTWAFGERRGRTESEIFKEMLWHGQVMWGMMVYDSLRAIDYLVSRDDVDAERIGTLGLSMGSTMAWWVAALDTRIKVCVDICCLTDFVSLIKMRGLDGHGIYYYVPNLLKHFTTAQINELIAPRPHLSLAGIYDSLTPPEGLDDIDAYLKNAYERENAAEAWQLIRYATGHFETADGRREIIRFLNQWLG
ncbi:acetylxylan esterase [candidate division KSB1 bacterium]|nr:acetylxylan esterase [candidate division KSB1 bacterium]